MKTVATMVAIALLLLAGPFAGPALAQPGVAPAVEGPLALDLDQMTPRMVTAAGPDSITVTGTLRNTGDRPVDGLAIRLQRGDPLRNEGELRDALEGDARTDAVSPDFVDLPGALAPGERRPVRLTVPLRGEPGTGLGIVRRRGLRAARQRQRGARGRCPGPAGGRADAAPGAVGAARPLDGRTTGVVEPEPARANPVTLLYPVVDAPRRLATVPGEQALLSDDVLADSFAPGGRLDGLVAALATSAPVGSRLREAVCLVVDPDLVQTAAAMRTGYLVRGKDGSTTPGRGAEAAGRWLDVLTATARGGCVLALPFADADLVALTRADLDGAVRNAVTGGREITAATLGTSVLPGVTWPIEGILDGATLAQVVAAGNDALVLSAEGVDRSRGSRTAGVLPIADGGRPQLGVLTDPLLTLAATGPVPAPATGGDTTGGQVATTTAPAGTPVPLSTQDLIGALAFRTQTDAPVDGPIVVAPPHQWAAEGTGARELLAATEQLVDSGRLEPRGLGEVISGGVGRTMAARAPAYPVRAGSREIPSAVTDVVRTTTADVADLRSAVTDEGAVGVAPEAVFGPLVQGLVRPTSSAWRGRPALAAQAATDSADRITELRSGVRVLEPPSPYSLGTTDAPLLFTVANALPVPVRVRVELSTTAGLRVAPVPEQRVPPLGRIQVRASAEVTRSGQFTVDAAVRTPAGGLLGPPSRLKVRSTAYGTITVWLTGTAAVLLVVLAARRVLRRIRGEPGRHAVPGTPDPPVPDGPPDQAVPPTTADPAVAPDPGPGGPPDHPAAGGPPPAPGPRRPPGPPGPAPAQPPGTPRDRAPRPPRPGSPPAGDRHRRRTDGPAPGRRRVRCRPTPVRHDAAAGHALRPFREVAGPDERAHRRREPGQPHHRLHAPARHRGGARARDRQRLLHGRQHAAQHRLRAAARRRPHQRDDPAAGPRPGRGRRRRRDLHPPPAHRGRHRLLLATLAAMLAAPLLTRLYLGGQTTSTANPDLATAFALLLLPQIFFYGLGSLLGALLNSRGVFGPFAWAPVLNNVVVLVVLGAFTLMPGEISLDPVRLGEPKLLVIGLGTTLGIVMQALVLIPAVRRTGFRYRPVWGWDPRLTSAGGLALWVVAYVLVGQVGYIVTTRVASSAAAGSVAIYTNAWLLLQVPYGVLGVSLLTALMPRMSRAAAAGRIDEVVADLSLGSRLSALALVPVSVLLTLFGTEVGVALFALRQANLDGAVRLGTALAVSAFGLLPFAVVMLQLRVFYALTDSRTPTLIQLVVVGVKVPLLLACPAFLPPEQVVLGLAAANGASFVVGAVIGQVLLHRRLGRLGTGRIIGTIARTTAAALAGGLVALGAVSALRAGPLAQLTPVAAAWATLGVTLVVMTPIVLVAMRLLRVHELDPLWARLGRLADRRKAGRRPPR